MTLKKSDSNLRDDISYSETVRATKINTITTKKISIDKVIESVRDTSCGALVLFLGTVRGDRTRSGIVTEMLYESYTTMARKQIAILEQEVKQRWHVKNVKIIHRIGRLQVGEISVVICIASAHRAEAFEACRYAIDRLKNIVPIWKKEILNTGTQIWVKGGNSIEVV
jgi:molybdopterin synthase catalytic subunit